MIFIIRFLSPWWIRDLTIKWAHFVMRKRSNYYVMECLWWDTDTYIILHASLKNISVEWLQFSPHHEFALLTPVLLHFHQGGFISSEWLNKPEPVFDKLKNVSLRKYMPWIHYWGGWSLFQEMLNTLDVIAKKHSVSISNVAVRLHLLVPHTVSLLPWAPPIMTQSVYTTLIRLMSWLVCRGVSLIIHTYDASDVVKLLVLLVRSCDISCLRLI